MPCGTSSRGHLVRRVPGRGKPAPLLPNRASLTLSLGKRTVELSKSLLVRTCGDKRSSGLCTSRGGRPLSATFAASGPTLEAHDGSQIGSRDRSRTDLG